VLAFFIWWVRVRVVKMGSLARAIGSGLALGLGLGSDVCQRGGDRIVTLKVVFLHFIWWERAKVRVRVVD
jgi:hypothetical protein